MSFVVVEDDRLGLRMVTGTEIEARPVSPSSPSSRKTPGSLRIYLQRSFLIKRSSREHAQDVRER